MPGPSFKVGNSFAHVLRPSQDSVLKAEDLSYIKPNHMGTEEMTQ